MYRFSSLEKIHITAFWASMRSKDDPVSPCREVLNLLGGMFSQIPSGALRSIKLTCRWTCETVFLCKAVKFCNWEPFRNALMSMTRLKTLEVDRLVIKYRSTRDTGPPIIFHTKLNFDVEKTFEDLLPELAHAGILKFPERW